VWLALLARSSTGQPLSIYTSAITGPAKEGDEDGPQEVHIILLDNGRSQQVGTPYEEALQCIRCGACLNVCPVYRESGGHAYGSPYSGPIGAVVTPMLMGLADFEALPQASSLCTACLDVCPARIDIPRMLLQLRADEVEEKVMPWHERVAERAAARVLSSDKSLRFVAGALRLLQTPLARNGHLRVPAALNPAKGRKLPALAKKSFREMWRKGEV
jgi:L-lactate dehydrogenase complex protein LldF